MAPDIGHGSTRTREPERFNIAHEDEVAAATEGGTIQNTGGSTVNGKRFLKELSDIKIKKFPKTSELKQWKHDFYAETNKTSDRLDGMSTEWLLEAEALSASNDTLRNSGKEFITLDQKLAIALMAVLPPPLRRRVLRIRESEMSDHRHIINGC